jgi:hypothetical protein
MKTYKASQAPLQLDGPGYAFALDAMKEQFPYYIKSVKYRQLNQDASSGREDVGYVKPRFTRPAGVKAGYYDTSITGTGKIEADQLNYQNFSINGNNRTAETKVYRSNTEEASKPEEPKYEERKVEMPSMGSQKETARNLRETLQKRTRTDKQYNSPTFNSIIPAGSDLTPSFKAAFPFTFGMTASEFSDAWDDNPDLTQMSMEKELRELSEFFIMGSTEDSLYRRFKNKGNDPVIKFDRSNPPIREALNGAKFDFGDELYRPGIASGRIGAKIKDGRDIGRAKALVSKILEQSGRENPQDLVNDPNSDINNEVRGIMRNQAEIVKSVQNDRNNTGNRRFSDATVEEELKTFEEIVKYFQLKTNYVESVKAEMESERERQMIAAGAATPNTLILNIDNPDAAEAFRAAAGLKKPTVIDENGEPIVTV